ncbi:MAG: enoyl-CoA hydratase/isomerase family protein [Chthoniobacterales bacterium]
MNWQTLEVAISGQTATVTLSRPDVSNAFNEAAVKELEDGFRALAKRSDIRVILLAAVGKSFSAGADLSWMKRMADLSAEENFTDAYRLATMLRTIYTCPQPVIARVQGDAYGGGVGLIAAADIVVAADNACFSLSEVKLGLIPATISPYVIRAIGVRAARRYFVTAERFDAAEAYRIGLVHKIASPDALDGAVESVVAAILQNGPGAVIKSKQLVQDLDGQLLSDELLADTARRIAQIRGSEEAREGVRAFLEKRLPAWAANASPRRSGRSYTQRNSNRR